MALIFGTGFYPLSSVLFSSFDDRGWIFSKAIGIALSGFLAFVLITSKAAVFTDVFVLGCTVVLIVICWMFKAVSGIKRRSFAGKNDADEKNTFTVNKPAENYLLNKENNIDIDLILLEELLFLAAFLMWTYFAGFYPQAYGTEKFMDYGFMAAMMRDETLPAKDLWYSLEDINYYYGGQYYAVFLTKLSGSTVNVTYNLMRTFVAAFAFAMPFGIVYHLLKDRRGDRKRADTEIGRDIAAEGIASEAGHKKGFAVFGGIIAGAAVSLAGNMHYVLYGLFGNVFKLSGYEDYWFPSSTRYIGHNPLNDDQCIHEFPSYSFVLGDLHAHVVNIMFVLCFAGILYAWFRSADSKRITTGTGVKNEGAVLRMSGFKAALLDPHIWILGLFSGIFQFTNYWDFVIYLTAAVIGVVLMALRKHEKGSRDNELITASMLVNIVILVITAFVAAIPFNSTFETMAQGLGIAQNHSALYQLAVLWGLPVSAVVMLFIFTLTNRKAVCLHVHREKQNSNVCFTDVASEQDTKQNVHEFKDSEAAENILKVNEDKTTRQHNRKSFLRDITLSDMTALLFGICAIGLVLIPEVVYIRDIYENGYARSNTMFKLTYQAFILFGMSMTYSVFRIISDAKRILARIISASMLFLLLLTFGYFPYAVNCWFGNVTDTSLYEGLDATAFLEVWFPEDAEAIRWLNENIEGNPTVLEAPGNSYSDYERVSAMTGLPTVVGWYVHEWLWRNDPDDLNEKIADIETIYTSDDQDEIMELIEEYDIEYIFVGRCEREEYENLNEQMLQSLGEAVFRGTVGENPAYVIYVG